jgi:signal transduction histidine kinase
MRKAYIKSIYFCGLLFLIPLLKKTVPLKEEAVAITASSFMVYSDSILKVRYAAIEKTLKEGAYTSALNHALYLKEDAIKENNQEILSNTNYLIGQIFERTNNIRKAINYYREVEIILKNKQLKDNDGKSLPPGLDTLYYKNLLKLGSSYQKLKVRDSISLYKDSTLYYYNKISLSNSLNKNILTVKAKAYNNMSTMFLRDLSYNKAREYALKAIEIHSNLNNTVSQASALSNLASIDLYQENYKQAKKIYSEAIDLIKNNTNDKAKKLLEDLYYNYAYTLYILKDYKAFDYQELSYNIKDEYIKKEFEKEVEEIYAKYNVSTFQKKAEIKQAKVEKKILIIVFSSIILITFLLFLIGYFKLRQRNLSLKLSKNLLIQEQKIERLKSISQKRVLNATIDGKESERKDIAETLHDSVSALLSSANLHLQASKRQFNGSAPLEIEKSQKIISEASRTIRDLSHHLVSSILLKFGLRYAALDMAKKYSNSEINLKANVSEINRFDQRFEIKIYNIIQELVNNILKHSKATKAEIKISEANNTLSISISDNGIGFSIKDVEEKDGLGINQIEARIQMMDGTFMVDSSPNKGTKIMIELPLKTLTINHHA